MLQLEHFDQIRRDPNVDLLKSGLHCYLIRSSGESPLGKADSVEFLPTDGKADPRMKQEVRPPLSTISMLDFCEI